MPMIKPLSQSFGGDLVSTFVGVSAEGIDGQTLASVLRPDWIQINAGDAKTFAVCLVLPMDLAKRVFRTKVVEKRKDHDSKSTVVLAAERRRSRKSLTKS